MDNHGAFIVSSTGDASHVSLHEHLLHMLAGLGLDRPAASRVVAGADLLSDDDYPYDKAAELLIAAEQDGKDAEALARKMLSIRKALRDDRGTTPHP